MWTQKKPVDDFDNPFKPEIQNNLISQVPIFFLRRRQDKKARIN